MCATAQGEMSATIFYYPGSYVRLVPALRTRLTSGGVPSANVKIGVSTNFDKLCGCVLQASCRCTLLHGLHPMMLIRTWPAGASL